MCMYIYIYIYIVGTAQFQHILEPLARERLDTRWSKYPSTPGLHNKIPAYKIFARGWVAQKSCCS